MRLGTAIVSDGRVTDARLDKLLVDELATALVPVFRRDVASKSMLNSSL